MPTAPGADRLADRRYVTLAALRAVAPDKAAKAVEKYEIDADAEAPWLR